MDHGLHLHAQRHHADVFTGLVTGVPQLLHALAGEGHQNALTLVLLHEGNGLGRVISAADDNGNTGDVAGNQRHAQIPDEGIGQMAQFRLGVGSGAVNVLQRFQKFGAQGGRNTGVKAVLQPVSVGAHGLDGRHGGLHFAEIGDLLAGNGVVAGEAVSGVGEGHGFALAVSGNCFVDGGDGTGIVVVAASEDSVKKCHSISS